MLAIVGSLLIPACGGGGGGGNDGFISVNQFMSGTGIFTTGTGNTMTVYATGYKTSDSRMTEGAWKSPVEFDTEEGTLTSMEGWGDNGVLTEKSPVMVGTVKFGDGAHLSAASIIYETMGEQYGHMVIYFGASELSSDTAQNQLAALFGVVRASDIDDAGNTRNLFWWNDSVGRYLATSMNNGRIELWINFNSRTALIQFYTQVAYVLNYNTNGTVEKWYGPSDAPIFTYDGATVSKDY